jgi:hypothetical protein
VAGADSPQSWRKVLDAPAQELTAGFYDKTELQMGDKSFEAQGPVEIHSLGILSEF